MGIFLKKIFLFALFSISIYVILIIIVGEIYPSALKNAYIGMSNTGGTKSRLKEVKNIEDVDVLVLGSSHAYRGYDPRIFAEHGYRIFNLGTTAQTFVQTEVILNRYIDSLDPELVILDVYPKLLESDGVESSFDLMKSDRKDFDWLSLLFEQKDMGLLNTSVFLEYKELVNQEEDFKHSGLRKMERYIPGGFVENPYKGFWGKQVLPMSIEPREIQLEAFQGIIESLQRQHLMYVIVQAPTTRQKDESFTNIEEFDMFFKTHGKYYNFNEILELDTTYFFDHSHLNQKGVEVFNHELLSILDTQDILPPISDK